MSPDTIRGSLLQEWARKPSNPCPFSIFTPHWSPKLPIPCPKSATLPVRHLCCSGCVRGNNLFYPSVWGATMGVRREFGQTSVLIHAPMWGATELNAFREKDVNEFQSTHPRGVRHYQPEYRSTPTSFNPRTHVGCDVISRYSSFFSPVSIHAPTWGATYYCWYCIGYTIVSIHAPTWGATYWSQ